jgi:ElaA protein
VLYEILQLRAAVFVVEQNCAFNDLDGRDTESGALHAFTLRDGSVVAALRILVQPDGSRELGRVVTAPAYRGRGIAGALIDEVLGLVPAGAAVHINAQSRLEPWYKRWGFGRSAPDVLIDGIVHVPMTRPGR